MTKISDSIASLEDRPKNSALVCIDFSEDSQAALVWACKHAMSTGMPLIMLHIVHDLASNPGFYQPEKAGHMEPIQDIAQSMMIQFLDLMKSQHPELTVLESVDVLLVPGLPPTRIIEVASLLDAKLIVLGGLGMTGHFHKRLGAVAHRVAELSRAPLVIVRSEKHAALSEKEIKKQKKKQKKERKRLKKLLENDSSSAGDRTD